MSRRISGRLIRHVVPAAETTFSSIMSEPKSLAPNRSATCAIFGRLLFRDAVADFLDEDLPAPARDGVETGTHELADHLLDRHPESAGEKIDFRGRKPVDVNRMVALDVAHQVQVPREGDVGIVAPLDEDLHAAERLQLVDLATDLLEREDVPLGVLRPPVERAELAVRDADIGVVDVPIDDVGDLVLRMQPPPRLVGEGAELEQ